MSMSEEKNSPTESTQPTEKPAETLGGQKPFIPVKKEFIEKAIQLLEEDESQELAELSAPQPKAGRARPEPAEPPWMLEQFFNGEIDLEAELALRFTSTPVMSTIKFRTLGANKARGVATIATQDGAAQVMFEADKNTRAVQASFSLNSMLSLRFSLRNLVDRTRWLELVRREEGGLAFLWSAHRWEQDYIICIARRYYTNFYAFSPNGLEAAARLTPEISHKLLHWLEDHWGKKEEDPTPAANMLTW